MSKEKAVIKSKILWDLKPFIGTITTAPETEIVSTVTGQDHTELKISEINAYYLNLLFLSNIKINLF